jgi:ABC-type uncharacterized transport system substrate-binding protein
MKFLSYSGLILFFSAEREAYMNILSDNYKWLLIGAALLFLFWAFSSHTPRILIIHSYNLDYSWSADMDKSLHNVLDKTPYEIKWAFMDTKNHPDKAYIQKSGAEMRDLVDDFAPDVLILLEDNAQKQIGEYYLNHDDINIVFAGVNNTTAAYGYDKAVNVTGILERVKYNSFKGITFHLLPPNKHRLFLISDKSVTATNMTKEVKSIPWKPLELIGNAQAKTFDDWKKAVKEAEKIADVLLVAQYATIRVSDTDSRIMEPKKIIDWTLKNSTLFSIGFWGFFVTDGGLLAAGPSPYEHGETAAQMAIKIIKDNIHANKIKTRENKNYVMYMRREDEVIKYRLQGLDLPIIYDAYALSNMK